MVLSSLFLYGLGNDARPSSSPPPTSQEEGEAHTTRTLIGQVVLLVLSEIPERHLQCAGEAKDGKGKMKGGSRRM